MDDIDYVETMLWRYWQELPFPKPEYTTWFYTQRKQIVQWLFSTDVETGDIKCD